MTDPIYCYYHRHARLEITQRHGQTYAVCPECRQLISLSCRGDLSHAWLYDSAPSDDILHKVVNVTNADRKAIARAYHR
ncbi:MAG: hypothetical protein KHX31_06380 [Akkermansia sp.]|uniref:hypothetical protein n=1 Tax=Akkermansia sp. TaxID=1872421 RepID=UPI0025BCBC84|nr:hypothetical protein [Akkermansia sp.]MBS5508244.1 hypothetical protein [Akkermansia sp.]